jgi:hypothetical protein
MRWRKRRHELDLVSSDHAGRFMSVRSAAEEPDQGELLHVAQLVRRKVYGHAHRNGEMRRAQTMTDGPADAEVCCQ